MPPLEEGTKAELRYIARERQAQLKSKLLDHPELGKQLGTGEDDDLTPLEQRLLGAERYRLYRAKMAEAFQQ